jgi:hypothetical protein
MAIPAPAAAPPSRPSPAWWFYVALLSLFALGGMVAFALQVGQVAAMPRGALAIGVVATALNLLGILGLLLYILQRPLIGRAFWQGVFGLTVLQLLFSAAQFARVLAMPGGGRESLVAAIGIGSILVGVPLLYALFTYAFRSPRLWRS